ncbi:MAG TPA: hypothetical protein VOA78_06290 [Candidatus Dormibacteraeota bacterium]|nr:hypothetical protein [Candidatus Dormibacteraeota bacterium]
MRFRYVIFLSLLGLFLISCGGGNSPGVLPTIRVSVAPASASVAVGQQKQFSASVSGTNNQSVNWSVVGAGNGTISASGLYTAPTSVPNPALVTVMATSQVNGADSGTAAVTVTSAAQNVTVVVSPGTADVATFGTKQFSAMVNGTANTAVTWQVNGTSGGSKQFGFVSSSGLYVAPSGVPTKSDGQGGSVTTTVTVAAISQADASAKGSAVVTLTVVGQNAQSGAIKLGSSGSNSKDSSVSGQTITCCGGTLGSLVARGGTQFILSNNHVLARSDSAAAGDAIANPGLVDNNCAAATTVANLTQFYNLETGPLPRVDAAIAQVVAGKVDAGGNILYLGATVDGNGVPVAAAPRAGTGIAALIGEPVAKSGRSTGLTCSTVFATNVNVQNVQYQKGCGTGTTFNVSYTNQVDITGGSFSAQGDSGSLIVDQNTADPVALLFAGSDVDTVGNPVSAVLNFFKSGANSVTFVGGGAHQVIGCTLPVKPQSAGLTVSAQASSESLQLATKVRDAHAAELMAPAAVQAVGVGASYDNPGEAAVVFFVTQGQSRAGIPAVVDGVRTRIVEGALFARRGAISAEDTQAMEQSVAPPQLVYTIAESEVARAKIVHAAHVDEWMNKAGVQGMGIGSSADAPGEAAMVIFTVRGVAHEAIPAVIDGVRTRVREGSRFRAGFGDKEPHRVCSAPATTANQKINSNKLPH